jgi:site-specific DNA-methyltransferase (adenine-specific)
MRWLVRMVTPKGGVVLDPFSGSGSTALAALAENCRAIVIEREARFARDIRAKLEAWSPDGRPRAQLMHRAKPKAHAAGLDTPLFQGLAAEGGAMAAETKQANDGAATEGRSTGLPAADRS